MSNTKTQYAARLVTPDDDFHRIHTYYKGSPYHPDGRQLLLTRFREVGFGEVCLLDLAGGEERVIGESEGVCDFHTGPGYFCDEGNKVLYKAKPGTMALYDLHTSETHFFEGNMDLYSGRLRDRFIEVDANWPFEEQHRMGIYLRNIDGTGKRLLADMGKLIQLSPHRSELMKAGLPFRLGAEISPDQRQARLSLITCGGFGLVKDFYTCPLDGDPSIRFHGRVGNHPSWHHNGRDLFAFAKPWTTMLGNLREYAGGEDFRFGLLARYNTATREIRVASDYKIRGACHVSCAPVGPFSVLDCFKGSARDTHVEILLYDERSERMEKIHEEDWIAPAHETRQRLVEEGSTKEKKYGVNPHPTFSRDGRKVIFNSCLDGVARLREIDLGEIFS